MKGATVAAVLCFVAAIAIVGTYTFNDYKRTQQKAELARVDEEDRTKEEETKEPAEEANNLVVKNQDEPEEPEEPAETVPEDTDAGTENDAGKGTNAGGNAQSTAGSGMSVNFGEDSKLLWPVNGTVLMSYSMDKTVYFSTLDQYKYNPALIIGGNVGEHIGAAAPGIVLSVEQNAQTGTTVTLDMGNGYTAIYGQLKDVAVEIGYYVNTGDALGYMSEPTKYYSVEGPNLYFEVQKDGVPVNPLDFVE